MEKKNNDEIFKEFQEFAQNKQKDNSGDTGFGFIILATNGEKTMVCVNSLPRDTFTMLLGLSKKEPEVMKAVSKAVMIKELHDMIKADVEEG